MKRLASAVLMLGFLGSTSSAQLQAQEINIVTADFNPNAPAPLEDQDLNFDSLGQSGVTSGEVHGEADPNPLEGWTWVESGNDVKVYDDNGHHVATFTGAANGSNDAGPIVDGPASGDAGGNWSR